MCQRHADSCVAVFLKPNHTLVTSRLHAFLTHYAHNYALMLIPTSLCRRIPHNLVLIYAMSFLVPLFTYQHTNHVSVVSQAAHCT